MCVKIEEYGYKEGQGLRTYSEEQIIKEYNRIYSRFCWNLKIYAHVKNGADVYVYSKKRCDDLYYQLYAVGQLTRSYYSKIMSKIERTYNRSREDGVIIEF